MEIAEVFDNVRRGFTSHTLALDDWGIFQFILLDNEQVGIISEKEKPVGGRLPKVYYDSKRMNSVSYARAIGRQMFNLIVESIGTKRTEKKILEEMKAAEQKQKIRLKFIDKVEELRGEGEIDFDRIIESKSTESVYFYKGRKRVLRISTHPSYLKSCKNSLIVKPEEIDNIRIDIQIDNG
jgi:hypothetical protein